MRRWGPRLRLHGSRPAWSAPRTRARGPTAAGRRGVLHRLYTGATSRTIHAAAAAGRPIACPIPVYTDFSDRRGETEPTVCHLEHASALANQLPRIRATLPRCFGVEALDQPLAPTCVPRIGAIRAALWRSSNHVGYLRRAGPLRLVRGVHLRYPNGGSRSVTANTNFTPPLPLPPPATVTSAATATATYTNTAAAAGQY